MRSPLIREVRFRQLSPARQQLVRICQRLDHGRIEQLQVLAGEPQFNPVPLLISNRKAAPPRREIGLRDFVLKQAVLDLLGHLDQIQNGVLQRIELHGGLPTRVIVQPVASGTLAGGNHDHE